MKQQEQEGEAGQTGVYVVSLLIPLLSLVFSTVQFYRGNISHGLGTLVAGTLGWMLWTILLLVLGGGSLISSLAAL